MNKDKIIRFLSRQAEKWMNANQCREINGTPKTGNSGKHKIDFYPRQILYSYIDKTETNFNKVNPKKCVKMTLSYLVLT